MLKLLLMLVKDVDYGSLGSLKLIYSSLKLLDTCKISLTQKTKKIKKIKKIKENKKPVSKKKEGKKLGCFWIAEGLEPQGRC